MEGVNQLTTNRLHYYNFIISVVFIPNYINFFTRFSLYKDHNGMIITLVPREKSRKVACVLSRTEVPPTKATTNKTCLLPHYPESN